MLQGKPLSSPPSVDSHKQCPSASSKLFKSHGPRLNGCNLPHAPVTIVAETAAASQNCVTQCAFVPRFAKNRCTKPVGREDGGPYCAEHMSALGLSRQDHGLSASPGGRDVTKDRNDATMIDNRMSLQDRLQIKFRARQGCSVASRAMATPHDPEDPYAFPDTDPVPEPQQAKTLPQAKTVPQVKMTPQAKAALQAKVAMQAKAALQTKSGHHGKLSVQTKTPLQAKTALQAKAAMLAKSAVQMKLVPSQQRTSAPVPARQSHSAALKNVSLAVQARQSGEAPASNHVERKTSPEDGAAPLSMAKLYPELAEKLERTKPKLDPKGKPEPKAKTSTKSSRTMNRLQTKIAQNKIKDKLKKNQGHSNQTTPEHQPSTPQPPVTVQTSLHVDTRTPCPTSPVVNVVDTSPVATSSPLSVSICNALPASAPSEQSLSARLSTAGGHSSLSTSPVNVAHFPPQLMGYSHALLPGAPIPSGAPYPSLPPHLPSFPFTQQQVHHFPSPVLPPPHLTPPHLTQPPGSGDNVTMATIPFTSPVGLSAYTVGGILPPSVPKPTGAPAHPHTPPLLLPPTPAHSHPQPQPQPPLPPPPYPQLPLFGPSMPLVQLRPKRPRGVLSSTEAKKRLKRHSAVKVYAYHASQKINTADLLHTGVDSSDSDDSDLDDELPWQHEWFSASDIEEDKDDEGFETDIQLQIRAIKLSLLRSRIRRQFSQLRKSQRANGSFRSFQQKALKAILNSARHCPQATSDTLLEIQTHKRPVEKAPCEDVSSKKQCLLEDEEEKCREPSLPYTNHCLKHIMYNVDQQLFDYCTAKFSDNTQCCIPVFDIRHELPLCPEHAAKADNYNKNPEPKPKKPRKKTKPSALTRPPKKGKKKRNQRKNIRPQKPIPPSEPIGSTDMPSVSSLAQQNGATGVTAAAVEAGPAEMPVINADDLAKNLQLEKPMDDLSDGGLDENLSPGTIDKSFELPLDTESATKFLDEHDLNDVLNKLPEEAFDLLAGTMKNGEFEPAHEETEELDSLSKLSDDALALINESNDDLAKQITDTILNQNMVPESLPGDLGQDSFHELAHSLSEQDLKSMSQALTSSVLNTALGQTTCTVVNPGPLVSNTLAMTPALPGAGLGSGQPTHGPTDHLTSQGGHLSVLQAQLAQGPLNQPSLQIQMPGTIATLGGATFTISPQGTLIPTTTNPQSGSMTSRAPAQLTVSQAAIQNLPLQSPSVTTLHTQPVTTVFNGTDGMITTLPQFAGNVTPQLVTASLQNPSSVPSPVVGVSRPQWGVVNPTLSQSDRPPPPAPNYHNGFPVLPTTATITPHTFTSPGGVKLAYPLHTLLPSDLNALLGSQILNTQSPNRPELNIISSSQNHPAASASTAPSTPQLQQPRSK